MTETSKIDTSSAMMGVLILQSITATRALLVVATAVIAAQFSFGQTAFPEIKDLKEVTVTLHRGGGLSSNPSYKLVISGDGTVRYEGYANVFTKGKRVGRISNSQVNQLIEAFRGSRFFELKAEYSSAATDLPGCSTEFQVGSFTKKVVDYGISSPNADTPDGQRSGAPQSLVELENRVDEISGSSRWVKGSLPRRLVHWH